jgi:hypothetical protein
MGIDMPEVLEALFHFHEGFQQFSIGKYLSAVCTALQNNILTNTLDPLEQLQLFCQYLKSSEMIRYTELRQFQRMERRELTALQLVRLELEREAKSIWLMCQ